VEATRHGITDAFAAAIAGRRSERMRVSTVQKWLISGFACLHLALALRAGGCSQYLMRTQRALFMSHAMAKWTPLYA
jgi:hypothetical protein